MSQPNPLLCLPFAGSGAGYFLTWRDWASPELVVVPLELPGHGRRFADALLADVHLAVADLVPEAADRIDGYGPVVLFGHSLGAVLAYELARGLEQRPGITVAHLFVSGSPSPWTPRTNRATELDDGEFLARVQEFAGYRHESFDDPEILDLLLPVLRADVAMHENYRPASDQPLRTPVTAVRGGDDILVSAEQAAGWRAATHAGFELVELPGGHMYLSDSVEPLMKLITAALGR